MATPLDPITKAVHDATAALLDQQIPDKLASTMNSFVTSGFGVVGDVLKIVRDLTAPAAPPPGP